MKHLIPGKRLYWDQSKNEFQIQISERVKLWLVITAVASFWAVTNIPPWYAENKKAYHEWQAWQVKTYEENNQTADKVAMGKLEYEVLHEGLNPYDKRAVTARYLAYYFQMGGRPSIDTAFPNHGIADWFYGKE